MNVKLMAAALLVASNGFAAAQGTGPGGSAPAPSSPAQQSAPAEKMAPAGKSAPGAAKDVPASSSSKATQSEKMAPSDKMAPKSGDVKNGTTAPKNSGAADSKTPSTSPSADQKTGTTPATNAKTGANADTKGDAAAPPPEKQSQISSAIKSEKVEEVTNVNFNISVGTVVPSTVHYYPLPSRIIEIYPEWRGYEFIRVRGKYIILRPKTHQIVYIIEG
jgi:hypothetical protein